MSNQTKLRRGTFQHIESELYSYHETRKEIIRLKNEILYGSTPADENVGGGRSNLPSDPTGEIAVLLTSHKKLEQLERIVNAIESVVEGLPEKKKEMIKLRYWTRSQTLTWEGVAQRIEKDRTTAIRWRNEIIREIANRIGWR
ncbi:transcriptional regulator [Paenibacillus larvae]